MQIRIDDGALRDVALARIQNRPALVWIDGREHQARLQQLGDAYELCLDDRSETIWLVVDRDTVFIHAFGRAWRTEVIDPADRPAADGDTTDVLTAPMPGTVVTVAVGAGEAVTAGQALVVIESMKMQSEIVAWRDGVVQRVHLQPGDTFDRGAGLVELQAVAAEVIGRP
ncbi:MAG: biotin/lipoyl-containing protein [Solirubrobacteraceae bacterium]